MVYVSSRGEICQSRPWGLSLFTDWFWGVLNFIYMLTLFNPGYNKLGNQYSRDYRPGPRPPRPPSRRPGGFGTISSCDGPPMMGGG